MRWTRTLGTAAVAVALAGCAAKPPAAALREGARMIDLYRGAPAAAEAAPADETSAAGPAWRCRWWLFSRRCRTAETPPADEPATDPSYARTAANELELLFSRLPNPDVYIYVPPHLATRERVPVPGYTTAVPLYDRVEYALPGEVEAGSGGGAEDPP